MQTLFFLAFIIFLLALFLLSLGWIVSKKSIRGSCGGISVIGPDGTDLSCETCPNRESNPNCDRRKKKSLDPID